MKRPKVVLKFDQVKKFTHEFLPAPTYNLKQVTLDTGRYYRQLSQEGEEVGLKYPSITTVLKESSTNDFSSIPEYYKIRGSERGNYMHDWAEEYVKNDLQLPLPKCTDWGELDVYNTGAALFYQLKPAIDNIEAVYMSEGQLKSEKYRIAGTVDLFCRINGKNIVADYKSSGYRKKEEDVLDYFVQGVFYAETIKETFNVHVDGVMILISTENEGFQTLYVGCGSPRYKAYRKHLVKARKHYLKLKGF